MNAQFLKDFTQCTVPWREKCTRFLNTTYSVEVKHSGVWRFSYSFVLMIIKENIYELCSVASYKICVMFIHKYISYPYGLHHRGILCICLYISYLYISIYNMHIIFQVTAETWNACMSLYEMRNFISTYCGLFPGKRNLGV